MVVRLRSRGSDSSDSCAPHRATGPAAAPPAGRARRGSRPRCAAPCTGRAFRGGCELNDERPAGALAAAAQRRFEGGEHVVHDGQRRGRGLRRWRRRGGGRVGRGGGHVEGRARVLAGPLGLGPRATSPGRARAHRPPRSTRPGASASASPAVRAARPGWPVCGAPSRPGPPPPYPHAPRRRDRPFSRAMQQPALVRPTVRALYHTRGSVIGRYCPGNAVSLR